MPYTPLTSVNITTLDELREFVQREFASISKELAETTVLELRPVYRAPEKPREGMIVSADGVEWDPGSGAGAYEYKGGVWTKL